MFDVFTALPVVVDEHMMIDMDTQTADEIPELHHGQETA